MSNEQADREASNALVTQAAFYAGALGRAHAETHEKGLMIDQLITDNRTRDGVIRQVRNEHDNLQKAFDNLQTAFEKEKNAREGAEMAERIEKKKVSDLKGEVVDLKHKAEMARIENERLQRVNIESHNERDHVQKQLHSNGEAGCGKQ